MYRKNLKKKRKKGYNQIFYSLPRGNDIEKNIFTTIYNP